MIAWDDNGLYKAMGVMMMGNYFLTRKFFNTDFLYFLTLILLALKFFNADFLYFVFNTNLFF